jgi:hypothetical protein
MACYMENSNNQHLSLWMDCKLKDKDNGKSTSVLDMDCFTPEVSFHLVLSSDSGGCYFHKSQQIYQPLEGDRQGKSLEIQNTVEEAKYGFDLMHVFKDSFAILLEKNK